MYLLFIMHRYYPRGGALDFIKAGTIDELKEFYKSNADRISERVSCYPDPRGQIVNYDTMEVVCECEGHDPWEAI